MDKTIFEAWIMFDEIDAYIDFLTEQEKVSDNTIRTYEQILERLADFLRQYNLTIQEIRKKHLEAYIGSLPENSKPSMINTHVYTIRSFFKFLLKHDYIEGDVSSALAAQKEIIKTPQIITEDEFRTLIGFNLINIFDFRDKALFMLFYETGARSSEIINLRIKDCDLTNRKVKLMNNFKVRELSFSEETKEILESYIKFRKICSENDYLFVSRSNSMLDKRSMHNIMYDHLREAKIIKPIRWMTFRATFANNLLNKGIDIRIVKQLLGQSHTYLTERYMYIEPEK